MTHRGRALTCSLALGVGALTVRQIHPWASNQTLWAEAHRHVPQAAQPLLNLAVEAMAHDDLVAANRWLTQAADHATDRTLKEYVLANQVSLRIREGRWAEAQVLATQRGPRSPIRQLCTQYARVPLCEATP